jgi:putative NADH-flavin reductase
MKNNIQVAVIGGTGKSGKYLVKHLLLQKFPIKLLHRKPETLQLNYPSIEIIKGDARDYQSINELFTGCQAVISCLSQPVGEPSIFSEATHHILKAMQAQDIKRYIVIAGLNVDTPFDNKSVVTQAGTNWMKKNYPLTTADRQVEYQLLVDSATDWTMVRLPLIDQTDAVGKTVVNLKDCPGDHISATDLALFLIDQLQSKEYVKQAPFIASI